MSRIISGSTKGALKVAELYKPSTWKAKSWLWRIGLVLGTYIVIVIALMFLWSYEPKNATVAKVLNKYAPKSAIVHTDPVTKKDDTSASTDTDAKTPTPSKPKVKPLKTGTTITASTLFILDTLLHKSGGYLSNDILPPGILMDNMPNWEYGVVRNLRDISTIYRNNFSTSGSQTEHDKDLIIFENKMNISRKSWAFPSSESAYGLAYDGLNNYFTRITDDDNYNAQFYARADNLNVYLKIMSTNLGSLSQKLATSVGSNQENTSLAGDKNASQSTKSPDRLFKKTSWYKVDNNFYEARGYTWAMLQELQAIKIDFKEVLEDKNATAYIQQIIRELESTQQAVWSPVVLNGNGFGFVTNHSLIMASYISRANALLNDLINLLERG